MAEVANTPDQDVLMDFNAHPHRGYHLLVPAYNQQLFGTSC